MRKTIKDFVCVKIYGTWGGLIKSYITLFGVGSWSDVQSTELWDLSDWEMRAPGISFLAWLIVVAVGRQGTACSASSRRRQTGGEQVGSWDVCVCKGVGDVWTCSWPHPPQMTVTATTQLCKPPFKSTDVLNSQYLPTQAQAINTFSHHPITGQLLGLHQINKIKHPTIKWACFWKEEGKSWGAKKGLGWYIITKSVQVQESWWKF